VNEDFIINAVAALAAILIVLLPTLIAPAYRPRVALTAYCLGTLAALWMGRSFFSGIWLRPNDVSSWTSGLPILVALVTGLISLHILRKLFQKS
jgi:hypothetical protein